MSKVQRYEDGGYNGYGVIEDDDGEYVLYSDYADLERQRDELVKLLKQVHLSGDCEWLYAEYGEVEWVGDRDELIASMGHTCRIQRKACVVCGKAVSLIAKAEKAG